jgi:hypothetical protein
MVRRRCVITSVFGALVLALVPATASASLRVAAWTSGERLAVARDGSALVTWRQAGRVHRAVVRGGRIAYGSHIGRRRAGRAVRPDVAYGVAEVVLPDGTHYALQRIRRLGQFGQLGAPELRFARWRGAEPQLSLTGEWAYHGRLPRMCGTATYHGRAFYGGRHTLSGRPLDAFGRNVYIDVLRGSRWFRIMGVLTRPRGFALLIRDPAWRGTRYRALVPGPNIDGDLAPDVTASTPMPAPGAANACPFGTGLYRNA